MAKLKRAAAKRANRANPREDKNVIPFNKEDKNTYQKSNSKKNVDLVCKTLNQESLLLAMENQSNHIIIASGSAGTGKTYLTSVWAVKQLHEGIIDKLVLVRSNVEVLGEKSIGALPGTLIEKCMHLIAPIIDQLDMFFSRKEIEKMLENGTLEIIPLAHIRGRSLKNCIMILEEAQNTTKDSMLAVLTRIGENTKLLITGDTKQNDRGSNSGLVDFISKLQDKEIAGIAHVEFTKADIQRHVIISEILNLYGQ